LLAVIAWLVGIAAVSAQLSATDSSDPINELDAWYTYSNSNETDDFDSRGALRFGTLFIAMVNGKYEFSTGTERLPSEFQQGATLEIQSTGEVIKGLVVKNMDSNHHEVPIHFDEEYQQYVVVLAEMGHFCFLDPRSPDNEQRYCFVVLPVHLMQSKQRILAVFVEHGMDYEDIGRDIRSALGVDKRVGHSEQGTVIGFSNAFESLGRVQSHIFTENLLFVIQYLVDGISSALDPSDNIVTLPVSNKLKKYAQPTVSERVSAVLAHLRWQHSAETRPGRNGSASDESDEDSASRSPSGSASGSESEEEYASEPEEGDRSSSGKGEGAGSEASGDGSAEEEDTENGPESEPEREPEEEREEEAEREEEGEEEGEREEEGEGKEEGKGDDKEHRRRMLLSADTKSEDGGDSAGAASSNEDDRESAGNNDNGEREEESAGNVDRRESERESERESVEREHSGESEEKEDNEESAGSSTSWIPADAMISSLESAESSFGDESSAGPAASGSQSRLGVPSGAWNEEEGMLLNYELQFSADPGATFCGRIIVEVDDERYEATSDVPNMLMPHLADILVSVAPIEGNKTGIAVRRMDHGEEHFIALAQIPNLKDQGYDQLRRVADALSVPIISELNAISGRSAAPKKPQKAHEDHPHGDGDHEVSIEVEVGSVSQHEDRARREVERARGRALEFTLSLEDGKCCVIKPSLSTMLHVLDFDEKDDDLNRSGRKLYLVDTDYVTLKAGDGALDTKGGAIRDIVFYLNTDAQLLAEEEWYQFLDISHHSRIRSMHKLLFSAGDVVASPKYSPFHLCAKWKEFDSGLSAKSGASCAENLYQNAGPLLSKNLKRTIKEINALAPEERQKMEALDSAGILQLERQWLQTLTQNMNELRQQFEGTEPANNDVTNRWEIHFALHNDLQSQVDMLRQQFMMIQAQSQRTSVKRERIEEQIKAFHDLLSEVEETSGEQSKRIKKFGETDIQSVLNEGQDVSQELKEMTEAVLSLQRNFHLEERMLDKVDKSIGDMNTEHAPETEKRVTTKTKVTVETKAGGGGGGPHRSGDAKKHTAN